MAYSDLTAARVDFLNSAKGKLLAKDFATATEQDMIISGALMRSLMSGIEFQPDYIDAYSFIVQSDLETALQNSANLDVLNGYFSNTRLTGQLLADNGVYMSVFNSLSALQSLLSSASANLVLDNQALLDQVFASVTLRTAFLMSVGINAETISNPLISGYLLDMLTVTGSNVGYSFEIDTSIADQLSFTYRGQSSSSSYDQFYVYSGASEGAKTTQLFYSIDVTVDSDAGPLSIDPSHGWITIYPENSGTYPAAINGSEIQIGHPSYPAHLVALSLSNSTSSS